MLTNIRKYCKKIKKILKSLVKYLKKKTINKFYVGSLKKKRFM